MTVDRYHGISSLLLRRRSSSRCRSSLCGTDRPRRSVNHRSAARSSSSWHRSSLRGTDRCHRGAGRRYAASIVVVVATSIVALLHRSSSSSRCLSPLCGNNSPRRSSLCRQPSLYGANLRYVAGRRSRCLVIVALSALFSRRLPLRQHGFDLIARTSSDGRSLKTASIKLDLLFTMANKW